MSWKTLLAIVAVAAALAALAWFAFGPEWQRLFPS
jgi:hypothetical protein